MSGPQHPGQGSAGQETFARVVLPEDSEGQPLAGSWHPPRSPETHLTYPHQIHTHPVAGCRIIPGTTLASSGKGFEKGT